MNDEDLVAVPRDGVTYVVSKGILKSAGYLKLPGAVIDLRATEIMSREFGVPERELVVKSGGFILPSEIPQGAKVIEPSARLV